MIPGTQNTYWYLAWSFTTSLNRKVTIWWGFFRLSAPTCAAKAAGAVSLKKPHHIITLQFSEVVKDHANHIVHKNQSTYFDLISMDILKCKIQTGQILMLKIHQLYSSILTLAEKEFLHFLDYSLFLLLQEYLLTC